MEYLQILAKTHAVIGLMSMVLACLADYISTRVNTIRIHGIIECCSFYFFLTGYVDSFIIYSAKLLTEEGTIIRVQLKCDKL